MNIYLITYFFTTKVKRTLVTQYGYNIYEDTDISIDRIQRQIEKIQELVKAEIIVLSFTKIK